MNTTENQEHSVPAPVALDASHEMAEEYEPAALLAELRAKDQEPRPTVLPDRLPVSAIKQMPALFQPRGIDERHIQELKRAIKVHGTLDPMVVMQVGPDTILLDGHHRFAAYEEAKVTDPVPVHYFSGTLEEAVLEAGKANSKAKLPMTTRERQNYAWRLVLLGAHSKRQIKEASGVSDTQVAIMRRVANALGNSAHDCQHWWQALKASKGLDTTMTPQEVDEWLAVQSQEYADRLSKEFGTKLSNNVELAARALDIHFGRRLPELALALRGYLPDDESAEDEDDF